MFCNRQLLHNVKKVIFKMLIGLVRTSIVLWFPVPYVQIFFFVNLSLFPEIKSWMKVWVSTH